MRFRLENLAKTRFGSFRYHILYVTGKLGDCAMKAKPDSQLQKVLVMAFLSAQKDPSCFDHGGGGGGWR